MIETVFEEMYLTWDLRQKLGEDGDRADDGTISAAAQSVIDELEDADWWRVMSAFETHFQREFADNILEWVDDLRPIYDDQEEHGWRDLQP